MSAYTRGIDGFWRECRSTIAELPEPAPAAWAFGATARHADELLELVLRGLKTATASALWDYQNAGESIPRAGELSIVLDGSGLPGALIETTAVAIVPFDEVDESHAYAEGEGDRSLAHWRRSHERYWRTHAESPLGFAPHMPVVCERLRLLYSASEPHRA